jgi:hypothetical protein
MNNSARGVAKRLASGTSFAELATTQDSRKRRVDYHEPFKALTAEVHQWGLECAVRPILTCCPVLWAAAKLPHDVPTVDESVHLGVLGLGKFFFEASRSLPF